MIQYSVLPNLVLLGFVEGTRAVRAQRGATGTDTYEDLQIEDANDRLCRLTARGVDNDSKIRKGAPMIEGPVDVPIPDRPSIGDFQPVDDSQQVSEFHYSKHLPLN